MWRGRTSREMVRTQFKRYYTSGLYDQALYPTVDGLYKELARHATVGMRLPLLAAASDGCVELLAVGRCGYCGKEWRRLLETRGVRLHGGHPLPRWDTDCVQRLVQRRVRDGQALPESLLDAYRLLSGGDMHCEDHRRWAMGRVPMQRLRRRLQRVDMCVEVLHARYSRLLHLQADDAAAAILPALSGCMAVAGALSVVLRRQEGLGKAVAPHHASVAE